MNSRFISRVPGFGRESWLVFSLRYIVYSGLVEIAISTNPSLRHIVTCTRIRALAFSTRALYCRDSEIVNLPSRHKTSNQCRLTLVQRRRRWTNVEPALIRRLVPAGSTLMLLSIFFLFQREPHSTKPASTTGQMWPNYLFT